MKTKILLIVSSLAILIGAEALDKDKDKDKDKKATGVTITNSPGAEVVNGVCVNGKCNGTVTTCDDKGKCTTKKL